MSQTILYAQKYRIYLTEEQRKLCYKHLNKCTDLYNYILSLKGKTYWHTYYKSADAQRKGIEVTEEMIEKWIEDAMDENSRMLYQQAKREYFLANRDKIKARKKEQKKPLNKPRAVSTVYLSRMVSLWKVNGWVSLKDVNSQSLINELRTLDKAMSNFFRGLEGERIGYPKRRQYDYPATFYSHQHNVITDDIIEVSRRNDPKKRKKMGESEHKKNKIRCQTLNIPKIPGIAIRLHRPIPKKSTIKGVTIIRNNIGEWYASITIEQKEVKIPVKKGKKVAVIDLNNANPYIKITDKRGVKEVTGEFYTKGISKIRFRSKEMKPARVLQGSRRYYFLKRGLGRRHKHIAKGRSEYLNNLTSFIVDEYDKIILHPIKVREKIKPKKRKKDHKTQEENKRLLDKGLFEFQRQLEYKAERNGVKFIVEKVGKKPKPKS